MKTTRSLLIPCLLIASGQLAVASIQPRQILGPGSVTTTTASATTTPLPSTTSASTSVTPTSDTATPTTSTTPTTTTTPVLSNTSTLPPTPTLPPPTLPSSTTLETPITTQSTSVNDQGSTVVLTITNTPTLTTSDTPSSTATKGADDGGASSGLGTGSIVGISVAGGVAALAIIAFLVWKFTRKRFADYDDNEAIKWPELNTHGATVDSHPLPVNHTGRSGFDTGSEASLSRAPSASNYSTPDLGGGSDPYAVPPLPHNNPNQPYRDDPTAATGYYDPYRGPIPGTLEHGGGEDYAGEAIPMTQLAGRSSPGPQAAYGGDYGAGRQSPGPQAAYGRAGSPGPQAAYGGGRASPGPQAAYGGRASPGPHAVYSAGRTSPGPQAAYDPYGGR